MNAFLLKNSNNIKLLELAKLEYTEHTVYIYTLQMVWNAASDTLGIT